MKTAIIIIAAILCLWGCKRNELCYDHQHGDLTIAVNWDSLQIPQQVKLPESVCISMYADNPETEIKGSLAYTYYRGTLGGNITVADNTYDFIVYNADTEMIQFRNTEQFETAEAYLPERTRTPYQSAASTEHIYYGPSSIANNNTREQPLIKEPDRLFGTCYGHAKIKVNQTKVRDTIYVYPHSRVMSVTLTVKVKGLEKAKSCRASLSGVTRGIKLASYCLCEDTGTTIFDMDKLSDNTISHTINAFGLNQSPNGTPPEEMIQHILTLEFVMRDNKVVAYEFDVEQKINFEDIGPEVDIPIEINDGQGIELPDIDTPPGGFDADADKWGDNTDIYL